MFSFNRSSSQPRSPAPTGPPPQPPNRSPSQTPTGSPSLSRQPAPRGSPGSHSSQLPNTLQDSISQGNYAVRPQSQATRSQSPTAANPTLIRQLEMMGFSTQLSIAALQACHNNVEVAIDFCLENQSSFVASPLSTPRGPQGSNAPPNSAPSAPSMSPSPSPLVQSAPGAIRSAGNNVTSNSAKAPTNASTKTSGAPMNSSSKESFSTAHSGNEDSDSDTDSVTMFMDDIDRQLHSVVSANAIRSLESDDLVTRIASQKLVAVREGSARVASQRTLNNDPTLQELQTTKPVSRPTSQRVRTSTAHASSADAGTEADGSSAEAIRQRNGMPVIITGLGSRDLDVGVVVSDSVDHADPTHITGRLQFSTDGNGTFFSSEESATDEWASERGESTDVGSTSGAPQRLSPVRLGLRSRESERWQSTDLDDEEEPAAKPPAIKPPPPPLAARTSITGATEPLHPTQPSVTQSAGPNYVTGQRSRDNSTERSSSADRANSIDRPSLLGLPPARMPDARLSQQGRPGVMPPPRGFARPVSSSIPMNPAATSGAATAATSSGASVATIPTVATTAFSGVTPTMAQSRSPPIPPRSSHQLPMTPLQIPADQVIVPSSVVSPFSSAATPSGPPSESSTGRNTFLGTFRRLMGDNTAESPTSRNRDFGQSNPDLSRFPQIPRRMLLPFEIFEVISEENPNRTEHRVFLTLKQPHKKNRSPQGSRTDRIYLGALSSSIRARRMGEAMAPPVWVSKEQHPNCVICDCSLTSGYIGQLGNHCRNCGYRVCSKCSTKWPSSMIPTTYHNNEKHVRVCDSCDILIERFAEALRTGKIEDAQAIFSTGNINAHCPLSIYDNLEYPIHAAVKSGNLSLVQWLLDDRAVPLVDAARKSFKTADGYTILGLAAKYGHTDIMKYLVTNHRCKVIEITNLLHMQRVLHVLFEAPGSIPGGSVVEGTNIPYAGRSGIGASDAVIALPYDGTGNPTDVTAADATIIGAESSQTAALGGVSTGPRNLYRRTRVSEVAVSRTAATIQRQLAAHQRGELAAGSHQIAGLFVNPTAAGRSTRGGAQEVQAYAVS